ncbi:hypothetical protein D3C80_2134460 [compost metagenome]
MLTDSRLLGPGAMFRAKQAGRNRVRVARSMDGSGMKVLSCFQEADPKQTLET